jgi:Zn-dependent protease/CBS domain-containing protein
VSYPTSRRTSSPRARAPGTYRLGTIAGIDVIVTNSFFVIIALMAVIIGPEIENRMPELGSWAYLAAAVFAVLFYGSVLLHEISHALAALSFDMPVRSINLHFMGGATDIEGEATTPWREFVIAVVGPLTSLAVGGIGWVLYHQLHGGLIVFTIGGLAWANLVVGALNLVPGLPLDGGRVLQSLVWAVSRRRSTGVIVAAWGGRVAAVAVTAYPLILFWTGHQPDIINYLFAFMIGSFLWAGATQALVSSKLRQRLPRLHARQLARPAIGVPADLPLSEAIRRAQEARAGSVVVISSDGRPAGIVNEAAVVSTPSERRPWLPIGDLARRLEDGLMLPADLVGEPLLMAMNRTPASEYVLLETDGTVYGVLVTKDVDAAFRAA